MNTRSFLSSLWLLGAVSGAAAQALPMEADPLLTRPLNLSVRKQTAPVIDPALTVVDKPASGSSPLPEAGARGNDDTDAAVRLPYGAGFETRQLGNAPGGNAAGAGRSGGSGGSGSGGGGGGRGGAGRGR
jgi:hypothetical protein